MRTVSVVLSAVTVASFECCIDNWKAVKASTNDFNAIASALCPNGGNSKHLSSHLSHQLTRN